MVRPNRARRTLAMLTSHNYPILSDVHSSLGGQSLAESVLLEYGRKFSQTSIVFVEGRGGSGVGKQKQRSTTCQVLLRRIVRNRWWVRSSRAQIKQHSIRQLEKGAGLNSIKSFSLAKDSYVVGHQEVDRPQHWQDSTQHTSWILLKPDVVFHHPAQSPTCEQG